ncbi:MULTISPECIES: exonuclease domain-containing protein [unclassified Novosphingobium]|uniref:exonuclease domain-containing protein n=1 Tax=unclassified Novosphingobium TaxID=2644732 RepID=UPI0006C89C36|nr:MULTISPECIES: exonuclease domain-containing protein [unclassified Novosphingobium]KPH65998.1 transposase [Novosphingobium sp. ST904]TCM33730.1 DNA polymerase-3 subunit epsilon [Novosphingobium sp. ST904]WRT95112.1 exonuclease domain-containing protein [Novosphingobium sp. RL4]
MTSQPNPAASPETETEPDFVVVDVETACSRVSSICQIGIVGFRNGRETFAYETLVDPRDEFSPFNVGIHGIRPEQVVGHPCFGDIHAAVTGHLAGRITVAHSHFDKGALAAACRIGELPEIETRWLDSVRVAKRAWPELPSHRLNILTSFLGIEHRHHDALSDARAAGMVIVRAIEHTGLGLDGWMTAPARKKIEVPQPATDGPLSGERVAILGEPRDGPLAQFVARAGGRVVASVGMTTTMLVVSTKNPYGRWVSAAPQHRKAQELRDAGRPIAILTEGDLRSRF